MGELKRFYKSKSLKGISGREYNFSGYSTKNYEFNRELPKQAGIFYIGKIDGDDKVLDHYDLKYHDDIFQKVLYYKEYLLTRDIKDEYHFFVLEEDGDTKQNYLDNAILDLNRAIYTKELSLE